MTAQIAADPEEPAAPDVSVVVPVYNELESLPLLVDAVRSACEPAAFTWELLLCDDGSRDGSDAECDRLAAEDPRVRALHFRRNFGQTAALDAGFRHARGRLVVAMDADLQNDPADIPALVAKAEEGYDVVKGWRLDRKDPFLTRTLPSRIANGIIGRVTGLPLHDYGCTLTLFRREVIDEIHLYGEMHRFIPVYAQAVGARILEVPVRHHPRRHGESKYGLARTFRVLLDLLTVHFLLGYNTKPIYFFGKVAGATLALAGGAWTWTLIKRFLWEQPLYTDPFFLIGAFLFLAGTQFLLFGLLAEMSMRTYYESQGKSSWILRSGPPPVPGA